MTLDSLKQLIIRERRAAFRLLCFVLPAALGLLALSIAANWRFATALSTEGARPVPWFFGWFIMLMVTQHIFGREWTGGGQRWLKRLSASRAQVFSAKLIMATLLCVLSMAILIGGNEVLINLLEPKKLGAFGNNWTTLYLIQYSVFIFGLGICTGCLVPSGAGAVALSLVLSICYPILTVLSFDHWLAYRDIHHDLLTPIAFAASPVLGIVLLFVSLAIFIGGHLHRRKHLRSVLVATVMFLLCLIPVGGVSAWMVHRHETISLDDEDLSIAGVRFQKGGGGRLYVTLFRPGLPNPHVLLLDAQSGEELSFQQQARARGYDVGRERFVLVDTSSSPLGGRSSSRRKKTEPQIVQLDMVVAQDGRSISQPQAPSPAEHMAASPDVIVRQGNLLSYVVGNKGKVVVFDKLKNRVVSSREYPVNSNVSIRTWQKYWVVSKKWQLDPGILEMGVELWSIFESGEERIVIPDIAMGQNSLLDQTIGFQGDGTVYYIHQDRQRIMKLDLTTRAVSLVFEATQEQFPLDTIRVSPQGGYILCVYGARSHGKKRQVGRRESWGILNTDTGLLQAQDGADVQPWIRLWPFGVDEFFVDTDKKDGEMKVTIRNTKTNVVLSRLPWGEVLNLSSQYDATTKRVFLPGKRDIRVLDLSTKKIEVLWQLKGSTTP